MLNRQLLSPCNSIGSGETSTFAVPVLYQFGTITRFPR